MVFCCGRSLSFTHTSGSLERGIERLRESEGEGGERHTERESEVEEMSQYKSSLPIGSVASKLVSDWHQLRNGLRGD